MDTRAKIITLEEAAALGERVRSEGRQLTLAAGCFDVLQAAHARFLNGIQYDGSVLLAAVYGDAAVCEIRRQPKPVLSAQARAQLVAAFGAVDYVLIWPSASLDALIQRLGPGRVEHATGERNIIEEVIARHKECST
jgi:bifunctional ADP-heptose synthase (sugar kinase/adenylyltransferase)